MAGWASSLNITAGHSVGGYVESNTDYILLQVSDSTAGTSDMQASEWSDSGSIMFSLTYLV